MKKIPLTQGKFALVDDEDFEWLSKFKWHAHKEKKRFYARRAVGVGEHGVIIIRMHVEILQHHALWVPSKITDHIDHNGLNNQKANLRVCTISENGRNKTAQKNNTSGFKGVSWHKQNGNWRASIQVDGKHKHLGSFASKMDAAKAYNKGAAKYYGEFAYLNEVSNEKTQQNINRVHEPKTGVA